MHARLVHIALVLLAGTVFLQPHVHNGHNHVPLCVSDLLGLRMWRQTGNSSIRSRSLCPRSPLTNHYVHTHRRGRSQHPGAQGTLSSGLLFSNTKSSFAYSNVFQARRNAVTESLEIHCSHAEDDSFGVSESRGATFRSRGKKNTNRWMWLICAPRKINCPSTNAKATTSKLWLGMIPSRLRFS